MRIKEVEQKVGMPSASIRYYEREGLLEPKRNAENNYREYSANDVERLEQIKVLRLLGITIEDIKSLYYGGVALNVAVEKRLEQLEDEERHLQEVRKACENILSRGMDLAILDEEILGGEKGVWKARLEQILEEDSTQVRLDKKQLNRHIAALLLWGYVMSLISTLIFRGRLTDVKVQTGAINGVGLILCGALFLFSLCGIIVYMTKSIKLQMVILHICTWAVAPMFLLVTSIFASEERQERICAFLPVFLLLTMGYILVLWILGERWDRMFTKDRYAVCIALGMAVILTVLSHMIIGEWLMPAIMFLAATLYIGLFWSVTNTDLNRYNRYYAVLSANRILNPVAVCISYRGKASTPFWR